MIFQINEFIISLFTAHQLLRAALTSRPVLHFGYYSFSKYSSGTLLVSHTPLTDK